MDRLPPAEFEQGQTEATEADKTNLVPAIVVRALCADNRLCE
jgi:hypothetical protein